MKIYCALFACFFSLPALQAQVFHRLHADVIVDDAPLQSPWAGGVSAPQWSVADFDNDGKMDLYAFDRDGNMHLPFRNVGAPGEIRYAFAPEFLANFPSSAGYVLLRDYDQDGAMDLFGFAGLPGIKLYDGYYENDQLKFDLWEVPHFGPDLLTVPLTSGGYTQLLASRPNLPAIDDIDGDGDLDILELNTISGSTINFFKNQSVEQGFGLDTLIYEPEDPCWMKLFIPSLTTSLVLSCSPDTCADDCALVNLSDLERNGGAHGGSTLATYDFDNDGDQELLYGDLQYPNMILVENDDNSGNDWGFSQDSVFPEYDQPVDLKDFPASFVLDVDNDGTVEFLFSPNAFSTFNSVQRDINNVWFYENTGSNEFPVLSIVKQNLIAEDMIDLGTGAQPAFFDANADGLLDFLVGNFTAFTDGASASSSLHLYQNIGTESVPVFTLADGNYLDFKQFGIQATGLAPCFGDLDNDGDQDLLIGLAEGAFAFVPNNGGAGNPVAWAPIQFNFQFLDVGKSATPIIHDLNKDGLPDLIVGEQNGTMNFLPNIGTPSQPQFDPVLDNTATVNNIDFGGVDTQNNLTGTLTGFSAPAILDFGDTIYLVTGSEYGHLEVYLVDTAKLLADTFVIVTEQFGGLREGTYARPAFANLNGDGFIDALIGNHRGGLSLFTSPFATDGSVPTRESVLALDFEVFPNPTDGALNLRLPAAKNTSLDSSYRLFSPLGQLVLDGKLAGQEATLHLGHLPAGLYLLQVQMGETVGVRKVVLR